MARGWESKSVEEQQAQASSTNSTTKNHLSPDQKARLRTIEGLHLSRQCILQQLQVSRDRRRTEQLETALADLEQQLRALGNS
jgi:hypothetical protein